MRFSQRGQYSLDYAILTIVVVAALAAMQMYVQKCKQGNLREAAESIGNPSSLPGSATLTIETTVSGEHIWREDDETHFYREVTTETQSEHGG